MRQPGTPELWSVQSAIEKKSAGKERTQCKQFELFCGQRSTENNPWGGVRPRYEGVAIVTRQAAANLPRHPEIFKRVDLPGGLDALHLSRHVSVR
jgi:hypothetical protein